MRTTGQKNRVTTKTLTKQSATVRIPRSLCEEASIFVGEEAEANTLNELVIESLREKLRRLKQQSVDEVFAGMATDTKYQQLTQQISAEFENSDLHALHQMEKK